MRKKIKIQWKKKYRYVNFISLFIYIKEKI